MNRTIAYLTDIHLDEDFVLENGVNPRKNWLRIVEDLHNRGITRVIFGGDIGAPAANSWFFESLTPFNIDITLGNHDTLAEARKHHQPDGWAGKIEGYYSKEDSCFKYLFLDSSSNTISEQQLAWLTTELNSEKEVILFIHHPILAVDTPVDRAYPLQNRETLQHHLQKREAATYIFCGHYHMSDDKKEGKIQQYITPSASYQIEKEAQELKMNTARFGYRLIDFNGPHIKTEIVWLDTE